MTVSMVLGATVSTLLFVVAAIHVYWGAGGHWPGKDERGCVETVVGPTPDGKMPGLMMCLAVAALLAVAGVLPWMVLGVFPISAPPWVLHVGLWGLVGVFALRGFGGYLERRLRPAIVGLPYDRLNRVLYSPLCLALAAMLAASAMLHPQ